MRTDFVWVICALSRICSRCKSPTWGRPYIKNKKEERIMKKFLAILLCLCTLLTVLVACKDTTETPEGPETPAEATYKLGMGGVVDMSSSATGNAQVDATVATVVTDADGKIVMCRIDVAQNKMVVTGGAVVADATFKTKMEKGSEYGMAGKVDANDDGVKLEWDAQAKAFEAYVVGKTVTDIKAMTTAANKLGYQMSTDEALLNAGCTIQITDFIAAVVKACEDDQAVSFTTAATFTLGVAAKTTAEESVAATEAANGTVKMYTDFAASVVADGKILASLNDAIQPNITINTAGEIVSAAVGKEGKATKREQKDLYGMAGKVDANGDGVKLEWNVQSAAFSKFVVGKTAAEVAAMETAANMLGYQMTTDADLLAAGCTIQITAIKAVVAQSATNAR